jgi:D-3-phosphoglycerate dehydrogenase
MATLKALVYDHLHPSIKEQLEGIGIVVDFQPELSANDITAHLSGINVLIGRTKIPITKEILLAAPDLRVIVRAGAGLDDIDIEAATELGIQVINAPEGNAPAVGEHAVALLLNLLHKVSQQCGIGHY